MPGRFSLRRNMKQIALLSDTHSYLDAHILKALEGADEIWHGGDFGSMEVVEKLRALAPLQGVWGNIDGLPIRVEFPELNVFHCEGVKVAMQHIGGYPGRYAKGVKEMLQAERPQLFISGHSHILKIMPDKALDLLHLNPGAAGRQGWHKVRTLVRFVVEGAALRDMQVVELAGR